MQWARGLFKGQDAFVVGDGPSLRGFDYRLLAGKNTIACCNAYFRMRDAGVLPSIWLFVDAQFVGEIKSKPHLIDPYAIEGTRIVCGPSCTLRDKGPVSRFFGATKPSRDPARLYYKEHSGAAAINLGVICDPTTLYLLGIDLTLDNKYESHAGPHRLDGVDGQVSHYTRQVHRYEEFASMGVRIVNLSEASLLKSYPKKSWREVLCAK